MGNGSVESEIYVWIIQKPENQHLENGGSTVFRTVLLKRGGAQ